jgi:hypothetical protein
MTDTKEDNKGLVSSLSKSNVSSDSDNAITEVAVSSGLVPVLPNPIFFQKVIDKLKQREIVKTKLQTHFNRQLITNIVSNVNFGNYINDNTSGIADPTTCYTVFWPTDRSSTLISDILPRNDIIKLNRWRDKPISIGLSGELSIARLISYALEIMFALCQSQEFQTNIFSDIDKKTGKQTPDDKIKNIIKEFAKGKLYNFKNAFGKTTQPTRLDFESEKPNELVLDMLLIMQQIKIRYNVVKNDPKLQLKLQILSDAYTLLTKIILTKSSLDSCQAESIKQLSDLDNGIESDAEIDVKNNFCLFNSYDFSAVVNTPFCPVMGSAKYNGVKAEFIFIIDNSAILGLVFVLEYYDENDDDYNNTKLIRSVMEQNNINSLDDFYKVINTPREFENDISIDNTIDLLLTVNLDPNDENNYPGNPKNMYNSLQKLGDSFKNISIPINKNDYEKLSKIFLRYNVFIGNVTTQNITNFSRDIRAHDYGGSPIRLFGIEFYIKHRIRQWLQITIKNDDNYTKEGTLNIIDDATLIGALKGKNLLEIDEFINFILSNESITIQGMFYNWNNSSVTGIVSDFVKEQYIKQYPANVLLYNPFKDYPEKINRLYLLMAIENYKEFETSQYINLKHRMFVFGLDLLKSLEDKKCDEYVVLHSGHLFKDKESDAEYNFKKLESIRNIGFVIKPYELPVNTLGVVDLCQKRKGVNSAPGAILVESTATEADAAHASLGDHTKRINISTDVDLYYNGLKCGTVYSGKYQKSSAEIKEINNAINSRFPYLNLLESLTKYKITKASEAKTKQHLIQLLTQPLEVSSHYPEENDDDYEMKNAFKTQWEQIGDFGNSLNEEIYNIYSDWLSSEIEDIQTQTLTAQSSAKLDSDKSDSAKPDSNIINKVREINSDSKQNSNINYYDRLKAILSELNTSNEDKNKYNIAFLNKTITNINSLQQTDIFIGISNLVNNFKNIQDRKTSLVNALRENIGNNIFTQIFAQVKNFAISLHKFYDSVNKSEYVSSSEKIILENNISEISRILYYKLNDDSNKFYGYIDLEQEERRKAEEAAAKLAAIEADKEAKRIKVEADKEAKRIIAEEKRLKVEENKRLISEEKRLKAEEKRLKATKGGSLEKYFNNFPIQQKGGDPESLNDWPIIGKNNYMMVLINGKYKFEPYYNENNSSYIQEQTTESVDTGMGMGTGIYSDEGQSMAQGKQDPYGSIEKRGEKLTGTDEFSGMSSSIYKPDIKEEDLNYAKERKFSSAQALAGVVKDTTDIEKDNSPKEESGKSTTGNNRLDEGLAKADEIIFNKPKSSSLKRSETYEPNRIKLDTTKGKGIFPSLERQNTPDPTPPLQRTITATKNYLQQQPQQQGQPQQRQQNFGGSKKTKKYRKKYKKKFTKYINKRIYVNKTKKLQNKRKRNI